MAEEEVTTGERIGALMARGAADPTRLAATGIRSMPARRSDSMRCRTSRINRARASGNSSVTAEGSSGTGDRRTGVSNDHRPHGSGREDCAPAAILIG